MAGEGSTFHFELAFALSDAAALLDRDGALQAEPAHGMPAPSAPSAPSAASAASAASAPSVGRTARVLLAEDSSVNQEVTRDLLALQGLDVEVVGDGRQALDRLFLAGPHSFDLVLMDLGMPVMDGFEATNELRLDAGFDDLPVIAVTSHALADVRERCLAGGMQDYLSKPIDPQRLYSVLSRWLGTSMRLIPPTPPRAEKAADGAADAPVHTQAQAQAAMAELRRTARMARTAQACRAPARPGARHPVPATQRRPTARTPARNGRSNLLRPHWRHRYCRP